jgi:hypothetical protein
MINDHGTNRADHKGHGAGTAFEALLLYASGTRTRWGLSISRTR